MRVWAVHHEEPTPDCGYALGEVGDQFGAQPAAGLGERPQEARDLFDVARSCIRSLPAELTDGAPLLRAAA